jgi:two-component system nitrogen regulation response regulator GlnG
MMKGESGHVLIADDEDSIRIVLRHALEAAGHVVEDVADGDAAFEALASGSYDLAFLDIRMPGASGLELLDRLRALGSDTAIVIITAQGTIETAMEAMKLGALDYLAKPFSLAEATALAQKAMHTRALEQEVRELRREVGRGVSPGGERLVGRSAALLDVFKTVGKVAGSNITVLVTGESGTGKEMVARAIHGASPRADAPFVAVNAAAIPQELLESELFGHERGAFTGAIDSRLGRFREATGGTLFLDEIGDMPLSLQAKLLRVLQSGEVTPVGGRQAVEVDVRIVAATHRDLEREVREGRFREDLLYRLRVVPIHLPPLRERADDIRALAEYFTQRYAAELAQASVSLADTTLERLASYEWPGNVRELENAIKRALVLSAGSVLVAQDFDFLGHDTPTPADSEATSLPQLVREQTLKTLAGPAPEEVYHQMMERIERPLLEAVLEHTAGNQLRAAALLGINRNTLRKKIVELAIDVPGRNE